MNAKNDNQVAVTGASILGPMYKDSAEFIEFLEQGSARERKEQLTGFKSAAHLSDRRMLKAVSQDDGYALAALEVMKKSSGYSNEDYSPWDVGFYVGAPPATPYDNENYFDAMKESRVGGQFDMKKFGEACMNARPTTLLLGLPNNVLCYGAIIMNAKGANSNYTSAHISSQLAVTNGANRIIRRGQKASVVGGFTASDAVINSMLKQNNLLASSMAGHKPFAEDSEGTRVADHAGFMLLEDSQEAKKHGREAMAYYVDSEQIANYEEGFAQVSNPKNLQNAMQRLLTKSGVSKEQVGVVFAHGMGVKRYDDYELAAYFELFSEGEASLVAVSKATGSTMEAGGLAEVIAASHFYKKGKVTEDLVVRGSGVVGSDKPYYMVLRASLFGDWHLLLMKSA